MQINNRKDALLLKHHKYWTETPCKNGHLTYRYTKTGACALCVQKRGTDKNAFEKLESAPYEGNRKDATLLKHHKYWTRRPCKNGHLTYRYTRSGGCALCVQKRGRDKTIFKKPEIEIYKGNREDAVRLGFSKYNSGTPCKNGHLNYRYTNSYMCVDCIQKRDKTPRVYPLPSPIYYGARKDAIERCYTKYNNGTTCKNGHRTYRYTKTATCAKCHLPPEKRIRLSPLSLFHPAYLTTRLAARLMGHQRYWTGVPCKKGHLTYRYAKSGTCAGCIGILTVPPSSP